MTCIIAHRGARSIAPENTLLAARKGFEAGAHLWETDISITRDGHLILFHDDTLERTTDVRVKFPGLSDYRVTDYSLEQIKSLDAGSYFVQTDPFGQIRANKVSRHDIETFQGIVIPTLEEGIEFTRQLNWQVNLELKKTGFSLQEISIPKKVIQAIEISGIRHDQVIISSFFHPWLREIQSLAPSIEVQALIDNLSDMDLESAGNTFSTYNILNTLVDAPLIRRMKQSGKKINVYTVNDASEVKKMMNAGVDGIFTDFPQLFSTIRPF